MHVTLQPITFMVVLLSGQKPVTPVPLIFELKAPLEASERHVAETGRKYPNQLVCPKYSIQVVAYSGETKFSFSFVVADAFLLPKLDRSAPEYSKEPIPA